MKTVNRIEIVIDAGHTPRVVDLLSKAGIDGYTLMRGVSGSGERGLRMSDEISGVSNNNYILTTCPPEKLDSLLSALRPLLKRVGGVCLISEARWLLH